MLSRYITVTGQYEGFHEWKDAPDEVAFLRAEHRHIFQWKLTIEVSHNDRELEFFLIKRNVEQEIQYRLNQFNRRNLGSCEQQAEYIIGVLRKHYGNRYMNVSVSEDGENGGTIEWDPYRLSSWPTRRGEDNDRTETSSLTR